MSAPFKNVRTLVVKIGTTLLSSEQGFDGRLLEPIVQDLARLKHSRKLNLLIVSSGAMGCGMDRLGLTERPKLLPKKQATAAVGQSRLMAIYEALFQTYGDGLRTAQVLLSAADLDSRRAYLNVRNTLNALFEFETVVPIINENDSTATEELRFGDNDTLAAKVASKINADLLVILSNVNGLYEGNPATDPNARLIEQVSVVTPEIEALAGDTAVATSIGGMQTKLKAAKIASLAGVPVVIANGNRPEVISRVIAGEGPMTVFGRSGNGLSHRKRWIAFGRTSKGVLVIDDGARDALVKSGRSLLPAGVVRVEGQFELGEAVTIRDSRGRDIARGLTNFGSKEMTLIQGKQSKAIESVLGRKDYDVVIHRDNLVILES